MTDPIQTMHRDDLERVRRLRAGDARAFQLFFDETFPRLYRFALRQCGDPTVAEDLTQSALTTALEGMARYRGEASLLAWCYGILRHQMRRHHVYAARQQPLDDECELDALIEVFTIEDFADPARQAEASQLRDRVHAVLDRLPDSYAEALEGRYVLGLSVRELATRQGRSEKAMESTLSRARDAFRAAFGTNQGFEVLS